MQKEKPVFSCIPASQACWRASWKVNSNTGGSMLHVLGRLPKNFLTGSNCEFSFLQGCSEIISTYGFLGSLRYACNKREEVWIIGVDYWCAV